MDENHVKLEELANGLQHSNIAEVKALAELSLRLLKEYDSLKLIFFKRISRDVIETHKDALEKLED